MAKRRKPVEFKVWVCIERFDPNVRDDDQYQEMDMPMGCSGTFVQLKGEDEETTAERALEAARQLHAYAQAIELPDWTE